ncbi:MAG: prolyl oligopeptidase family serine peptidase [Spirochaetales bacterium]|nr:prolyl oligopeptidase family serine peptidase [Spirochaetales bacterium]
MDYINKARACFVKAIDLLDSPVTFFSIPFGRGAMPGYFFRPDNLEKKRKTLIMIGGGDTIVEDLYYYIVPSGLRRDYNVLIVDLPGQGTLPFEGLTWMADTESPMGKVIDFLLKQPGVDEEKISAFGISGGGYLVPRAATKEKRLKAICASAVILDWYKLWTISTSIGSIAKIENSWLFSLLKLIKGKSFRVSMGIIDTYLWRWGVGSIKELLEVSKPMSLDPSEISCPTLILVGESEYALEYNRYCQDHSMNTIDNPNKKLVITKQIEGAEGHTLGTNIAYMSQLLFDWLDEVL